MPQQFVSEYGFEPGDYMAELVAEFQDRCPDLVEREVTEAIFVDDGPVDYLVWFVLDDYEEHTFFYHDAAPDGEFLQRLLFSPAPRNGHSSRSSCGHSTTATGNWTSHACSNSQIRTNRSSGRDPD